MSKPTRKPRIFPSLLSMLSRCSYQAKLRYVDGLKRAPGVGAIRGRAIDVTVNDELAHKRDTSKLLTDEAIEDNAASNFDAAWIGEEPELSPKERGLGRNAVRGAAKDFTVRASLAYHREAAPRISPVFIQRKIEIEAPGFPFDFSCILDVAEPDTIRDLKSSTKAFAQDAAAKSVQLTFNAWAAAKVGHSVSSVAFDVVRAMKTKTDVQEITAPTPPFDPLLRRIEHAADVMEKGAFYPVDASGPSGWVCSEGACGYWKDDCPFGRRARVQL